jgi:ribosomal protein S27AE
MALGYSSGMPPIKPPAYMKVKKKKRKCKNCGAEMRMPRSPFDSPTCPVCGGYEYKYED